MSNTNLHTAKSAKNDEFYTQMSDIVAELEHYKDQFRGKVVYCNCDDPSKSNFYAYFATNFSALGLKDLLYNSLETTGHGDFRSEQAIAKLNRADIVVTNPPFSLFREFLAQLVEYNKQFLILGNMSYMTNVTTIFEMYQRGEIQYGVNPRLVEFARPDGGIEKLGNVMWYTNLTHSKQADLLPLTKTYNALDYPEYDNLYAIEVSRVKDIPYDYSGLMGVPVTYLIKHNSTQFEIVGMDAQALTNLNHLSKPNWNKRKDKAFVNGKCLYARILIRNRKLQGVI